MRRRTVVERPNWQETVGAQGLTFWPTPAGFQTPDGRELFTSYWGETGFYEFTEGQVDKLYGAAETVYAALAAATEYVLKPGNEKWLDWMQVPAFMWAALRTSWDMENPSAPSVFGRFDFSYGGGDTPKVLELNGDTPTSLLEAAIVQWRWLIDHFGPEGITPNARYDQWGFIHETLVTQWTHLQEQFTEQYGELPTLFLACAREDSGEDWMNVEYMALAAREAGWKTQIVYIDEVRYDRGTKSYSYYNEEAGTNHPIKVLFKLYPWEWMAAEEGADAAFKFMYGRGDRVTTWIEPPYKVLMSNKGIWAAVWELFKGDATVSRYLLPTFFEHDPRANDLKSYASKPIMAREGAGVHIVRGGTVLEESANHDYDRVPRIRQELALLPDFDGHHPVLGIWMGGSPEGDAPMGMGIRETRGYITGNTATFAPHAYIKGEHGLYTPNNT